MFPYRCRVAAEHADEFVDALFAVQFRDGGVRSAVGFGLADRKLVLGAAGDLVQVGDGQDLVMLSQIAERFADAVTYLTADTGIHFIKN